MGKFGHDPPDIGQKAHIEHVIGLVQDQGLDAGQVHVPAVDQVQQPAWASYQDTGLTGGPDLRALAHSTENSGRADPGLPTQGDKGFMNLQGQFARGREHKHSGRTVPVVCLCGDQMLQKWQGKGRSLACSGLGQAQNVSPGQSCRHGLDLNGGRGNIATVTDIGEDAPVQRKRGKVHKNSCA